MTHSKTSRRQWLSRIAAMLGGLLCLGGKGNDAAAGAAAGALDSVEPIDEVSYSYCDGIEEVESITTFEYDEFGRLTRVTYEWNVEEEGE